jgi:hypothetical protein
MRPTGPAGAGVGRGAAAPHREAAKRNRRAVFFGADRTVNETIAARAVAPGVLVNHFIRVRRRELEVC